MSDEYHSGSLKINVIANLAVRQGVAIQFRANALNQRQRRCNGLIRHYFRQPEKYNKNKTPHSSGLYFQPKRSNHDETEKSAQIFGLRPD
ncbi:MAG: hypothetical protein IJM09_03225 [Neisseriaceae bacterium]|nr:hypothetical protein [Neisseriaceae bacterium]